jgi:simple sugar transport system permease protein
MIINAANTVETTQANDRYKKRGIFARFQAHSAGNVAIIFILALAACIIVGLIAPTHFRFLSSANLSILLRAVPTIGIIALGVGILMIAGEYDLSVGAVFGVSSYVMVYTYTEGVPLGFAIMIGFLVAGLIGAANGWITIRFAIPSFITTLGTLYIVRSCGRILSGNTPISFFPDAWFQSLMTGKLFGFLQAQFVWFVALSIVGYLILNRHWLGNHLFAVGGNRNAAIQVGINANRTKLTAFILCSLFAAFAGVISVTRVNSGTTETQSFMELEAVAICVMGGLALNGGRGSLVGVVMGACMLNLVKDVILLSRLPGFYLDLFIGIIIVFGVTLNQVAKKKY